MCAFSGQIWQVCLSLSRENQRWDSLDPDFCLLVCHFRVSIKFIPSVQCWVHFSFFPSFISLASLSSGASVSCHSLGVSAKCVYKLALWAPQYSLVIKHMLVNWHSWFPECNSAVTNISHYDIPPSVLSCGDGLAYWHRKRWHQNILFTPQ